ncbi:transcriptional regulator with XRE-family HTH domain [Neisseria perflava]|uniref:helix-turn-helix domain-containing protein n=1 Tax=Neisseria perflava TaxID=33053 RepID=UPI00209F2FD9|nr:helix-turn-helix transcriptional regulator [Neisseria perflava]MCP1772469.1 transcriptional regulator with XRE-family HTH domain [Neisseria perflava]
MTNHLKTQDINKAIGKAIARQRQKSGFTQEQIAEKLEIGNETISRIERGIIMPNVMRLIELAEIFNCSASDLLGESSPRTQDQSSYVDSLISSLDAEDRMLMIRMVEMMVERLKTEEVKALTFAYQLQLS